MLQQLDRFGRISSTVIRETGDDLVATCRALEPVLAGLETSSAELPESVEAILSFPFPDEVLRAARGDYVNLAVEIDLTPLTVLAQLDRARPRRRHGPGRSTMNPSVRMRLLVFALVGGLAVVVAGVRYAGIWDAVRPSSYEVRVELARSGGIFERAEVTYRGVTVGRVEEVDFRRDGVTAVLAIDDEWRIPVRADGQRAQPVGGGGAVRRPGAEPRRRAVPRDGDVVAAADTTTPVDDRRAARGGRRLPPLGAAPRPRGGHP